MSRPEEDLISEFDDNFVWERLTLEGHALESATGTQENATDSETYASGGATFRLQPSSRTLLLV